MEAGMDQMSELVRSNDGLRRILNLDILKRVIPGLSKKYLEALWKYIALERERFVVLAESQGALITKESVLWIHRNKAAFTQRVNVIIATLYEGRRQEVGNSPEEIRKHVHRLSQDIVTANEIEAFIAARAINDLENYTKELDDVLVFINFMLWKYPPV